MSEQDIRAELEHAAAVAARSTAGVAFLRPGLTGLLRGAAHRGADRVRSAVGAAVAGDAATEAGGRARPEGVRAVRNDTDGTWTIELRLTVRRGFRAADVTRAVRLAVEDATRPVVDAGDGSGHGTVQVPVIVTGLV